MNLLSGDPTVPPKANTYSTLREVFKAALDYKSPHPPIFRMPCFTAQPRVKAIHRCFGPAGRDIADV
jgi:hypothetical protein